MATGAAACGGEAAVAAAAAASATAGTTGPPARSGDDSPPVGSPGTPHNDSAATANAHASDPHTQSVSGASGGAGDTTEESAGRGEWLRTGTGRVVNSSLEGGSYGASASGQEEHSSFQDIGCASDYERVLII